MNYLEKARALVRSRPAAASPEGPDRPRNTEEPRGAAPVVGAAVDADRPAAGGIPAGAPPCESEGFPCSEIGTRNTYCGRFCRPAFRREAERLGLRVVEGGRP